MGRVRVYWQRLKAWYETNYTWRGLAAMLWFLATVIPDMFGREDFWSIHLPALWKHIYAHGTIATVIIVGLIIWLDHKRMVRRPSPVADHSLRGRTLAFCEELREFKKEMGKQPEVNYTSEMSLPEFNEKNIELARREQQMHHGFHLRFYDNAVHLWHEHGAEMRESAGLAQDLAGRIDSDERLDAVIKEFSDLARMMEG